MQEVSAVSGTSLMNNEVNMDDDSCPWEFSGPSSSSSLPNPRSTSNSIYEYINRDFTASYTFKFNTTIPPGLLSHMNQQEFETIIKRINEIMEPAELVTWKTAAHKILSIITINISTYFTSSTYTKCLEILYQYLKQINSTMLIEKRVYIHNPFHTGLRVLIFEKK